MNKKAEDLKRASIEDATVEAGVAESDTVHQLVDKWATMNLGRTILTGVAAVLATYAAVDTLKVASDTARSAGEAFKYAV